MTAAKVALLGVPYDASSSYQRGPAAAPVLIREALWSEAGNTWTEPGLDLKDGRLDDEGDLWFTDREPGADARARIEEAVGIHSRLRPAAAAPRRRPLDHLSGPPRDAARTTRGSASCTSTPIPISTTSSRATPTRTRAPSPGSWRRGSPTGWSRSESGP